MVIRFVASMIRPILATNINMVIYVSASVLASSEYRVAVYELFQAGAQAGRFLL